MLEILQLPLDARPAELGGATVADELLRPTIIYAEAFAALRRAGVPWKAAAHITGGGLIENPPRIFADDALAVELDAGDLGRSRRSCTLIARAGVAPREMYRTFNMGLGMIIVVPADAAAAAPSRSPATRARAWSARLVPRAGGEPSRISEVPAAMKLGVLVVRQRAPTSRRCSTPRPAASSRPPRSRS